MDLKLLEKLVRLANNNPNENEANTAARKVCKLIQEANFKFVEHIPTQQVQNPYYGGYTLSNQFMNCSKCRKIISILEYYVNNGCCSMCK